MRCWPWGVIAAGLMLSVRQAWAQEVPCEGRTLEVRRLDFDGNTQYRDDQLALRIVTSPSSVARRYLRVIGQRRCYDSTTVAEDARRLLLFYHARGFRGTRAEPAVTPLGTRAVAVRFGIVEGRPLLIDSLAINGLDEVAVRDRVMRDLPVRLGDRMDRAALDAMRDSITRRLRNAGYPMAEVFRNIDTDTAALRAKVWFDAAPGARMKIGAIAISVNKARGSGAGVHPGRVRAMLGIDSGEVFSERNLEGVKRGLYLTEAFQHVDVTVDTTSLIDGADSLVTVNVTLQEGQLHGSRASLGGGNYDCLRAQGSLTTVNFLGGLRRLDLNARLSRVGVSDDVISSVVCPRVRDDPVARGELNYYVGATYSQPPLFGRRVFPSLTLFSERRAEYLTFLKDTRFGSQAALQVGGRIPVSFSYQLEYGSTRANPGYFCSVFNVCDRETFLELSEQNRRTATLGFSAVRSTANSLSDPSRGSVLQLDLRHASPGVGSDPFVEFTRGSVDAAWYFALPSDARLVLRARGGTVFAEQRLGAAQRFIPPQERLYAGGPNSVRGFGPNQLGSLFYKVNRADFSVVRDGNDAYLRVNPRSGSKEPDQPTGGDNVVVLNAEVRMRSPLYPELAQLALFVDAGQVWNRRGESIRTSLRQLRSTPGIGLRVFTPIGPVRMDVALAPRKLPVGPVYFVDESASVDGQANPNFGEVYCVSPTNTLRITEGPGGERLQEGGSCPGTFLPTRRRNFLSFLRFNFSIGQPF